MGKIRRHGDPTAAAMTAPDEHRHYEHYDPAMANRLDGAWGRVDSRLNQWIDRQLGEAHRVLDIGCGFGSLTDRLARRRRVIGIDPLLFCLGAGRRRYPRLTAVCGSAEALPLPDRGADSAVLKDVLHHLVDETSIERVLAELDRAGVRRIVVVEPNPNPLLLAARRLVGHTDPVCGPDEAAALLAGAGFRVTPPVYRVLFSLPLSGGYVGPVLTPGWGPLWKLLLGLEDFACAVLGRLGLSRWLCWRYCLVASREDAAGRLEGGRAAKAGPSRAKSAR